MRFLVSILIAANSVQFATGAETLKLHYKEVQEVVAQDKELVEAIDQNQKSLGGFFEAWKNRRAFQDSFSVVSFSRNEQQKIVPVGLDVVEVGKGQVRGHMFRNSLPQRNSAEISTVGFEEIVDWRYRDCFHLLGGKVYRLLFRRLGKAEARRIRDELSFGIETTAEFSRIREFLRKPASLKYDDALFESENEEVQVFLPPAGPGFVPVHATRLNLPEINCLFGNRESTKVLFDHGCFTEIESQYSPIVFCADTGNLETALSLIDCGFDVDNVDGETGLSPLIIAVARDHYAFARGVLQAGASCEVGCFRGRPAIFYCQSARMIELLAEHNADLNARDSDGLTALDKFEQDCNTSLVAAIVKLGGKRSGVPVIADPDPTDTYEIGYGAALPIPSLKEK